MDKGKGRAVDADEGAEQAYDESLRAALGDDGGDDSSTAGPDAGDGAQDDEGTFIYNGLDDEDTQEFIKDASLKHRSYQERLRGVLEGDESEHGEGGDAVAGQAVRFGQARCVCSKLTSCFISSRLLRLKYLCMTLHQVRGQQFQTAQ